MTTLRATAALAAPAIAAAASAGSVPYVFAFNAPGGSLTQSTVIEVPVAGTLIGNYDPVDNPTGTQTRPGLFGGSGNNPIPFSATLVGSTDAAATPAGGVVISIDAEGLVGTIADLVLEVAPSPPAAVEGDIVVTYSSFNTANPTAVFPGGVPITIPFGTVAEVLSIEFAQTAPVPALVSPAGDGFVVTAAVPVAVTIEAIVLGEPFVTKTPVNALLPFEATVSLGGIPQIALSADGAFMETIVIEPIAFADVPFDVPTILPPGNIANLLLSGAIDEATVDFSAQVDVGGSGAPNCGTGDLDCDGAVGGTDLGLLLGAWNTTGPFGDLNADGVVDAADLGLLLGAWD